MTTYTPCKFAPIYCNADGVLDINQADIEEIAPISGMTRERAVAYARAAYGEDAGIQNDDDRIAEPA